MTKEEKKKAYNKKYRQEHKEDAKKYYESHREQKKEYGKNHYQEHKEEKKEYGKNYYQEHREKLKEYRNSHKEKRAEYSKEYYSRPEIKRKRTEYRKKHYEENKENYNARQTERYIKRKKNKDRLADWVTEKYENIPCMDCDLVFPWECMDFDHRPEEVKSFGISTKGRLSITSENIALIEKEIAKCDLICSNDHRIRTKERYRSQYGCYKNEDL